MRFDRSTWYWPLRASRDNGVRMSEHILVVDDEPELVKTWNTG